MSDFSMSSLGEAAVQMHEMFTEFTRVGFSEDHAIKLVVGLVTGMQSDK